MTKSLQEFRATRQIVLKDADWCKDWAIGETSQRIAEYEGGCFIYANEGEPFHLVITNCEWQADNIEELEEILYHEWYLPEVVGVPREQ